MQLANKKRCQNSLENLQFNFKSCFRKELNMEATVIIKGAVTYSAENWQNNYMLKKNCMYICTTCKHYMQTSFVLWFSGYCFECLNKFPAHLMPLHNRLAKSFSDMRKNMNSRIFKPQRNLYVDLGILNCEEMGKKYLNLCL